MNAGIAATRAHFGFTSINSALPPITSSLFPGDQPVSHDTTSRFPILLNVPASSSSSLLLRILFKLRQRGIHFVPRVRVTCPYVHLQFEPTRIIQARGSDRHKLRNGIGLDHNGRATVRTKAPAGHAAVFAGRRMKAGRALQELQSFRRHDDKRRKWPATGSLAIATVTVKHQNRCGCGFVANRAASASTGQGSCCAHVIIVICRF